MDITSLRQQLSALISDDPAIRDRVRLALFTLDEDAVTLLVEEFFAGVSEPLGLAMLDVVSEIGGPEALSMLRNVYHFEDRRESWKQAAARGLLRNRNGLDAKEVEELLHYSGE
jgi:hypothetical protein